ncbi:MAG: hypothetical protein M0P01_11140 [Treponema sp.]|nr:hypothetical protein [Treponema sp.]
MIKYREILRLTNLGISQRQVVSCCHVSQKTVVKIQKKTAADSCRTGAFIQAEYSIFGGRLGMYKYFDMDDTIAAALDLAKKIM